MSTSSPRPNVGGFLLLMFCIAGWVCVFLLFTRNPLVSSVAGTLSPKSSLTLSDNRFVTTDGQYVTLWQVTGDNKLVRKDTQLMVEWSRRIEDMKQMAPGMVGAVTGNTSSTAPVLTQGSEFSKQPDNPLESSGSMQPPPTAPDPQNTVP